MVCNDSHHRHGQRGRRELLLVSHPGLLPLEHPLVDTRDHSTDIWTGSPQIIEAGGRVLLWTLGATNGTSLRIGVCVSHRILES